MSNPAADPKSAPLADDLRGFAISLPATVFPKNFFCALCSQLAVDAWKLLCCNKVICSSCQANLQFPTTCPSCDHSPLEADSCAPNKALRNTMRVWLEKRKKKEEAKAAAQVTTPPVEGTPAAPEVQPAGPVADKPVESVDEVSTTEPVPVEHSSIAVDSAAVVTERAVSASAPPNDVGLQFPAFSSHIGKLESCKQEAGDGRARLRRMNTINVARASDFGAHLISCYTVANPVQDIISPQVDSERRGSNASQSVAKSIEPSATGGSIDEHTANGANGGMMGSNPMANGVQGQMGFGFPNQAGFNNGMGWNGMNQMNGMPNMMANGNWNDFNNMNGMSTGMYGNFGGNMGMSMNDMSAMNMMNYSGGYGNGWNGMGGGYGNFNGHNQMGGYNQSGAYPEMMNQFPKNNFPNQNQNRFHANQGGAYPQRNNRNGSQGGFGPGVQNANSPPGSRSGPAHNVRQLHHHIPPRPSPSVGNISSLATDKCLSKQRDGQSPDGTANTAPEVKAEGEQTKTSAESTEEGKYLIDGASDSVDPQATQEASASGTGENSNEATTQAGVDLNETTQDGGLKKIQTVDSVDTDLEGYDQSMMGNGMQSNMPYPQGMINHFANQPMNASFDPSMSMNMNMGFDRNNNFGPRGGFNNGAYGVARVLTGQPTEPIGVGVAGAPTGPRAMREGRPNTGFSSRVNSGRYNPPPKSVTPAQDAAPPPGSPQRRVRSRSPQRDESLRVKERSPTRSRSRSKSRGGEDDRDERRERSQSPDRESRREGRDRSPTPQADDDYERRKERRHHRSSRHGDRDEDFDDRHRDDRASRGDRTRTASVESKYRSGRREKEKHRSSRSHRDRSKEHRRRHRSRSPAEDKYEDEEAQTNGEKDSDGSSRRKHRSGDKDKHRERSRDRDRERDRKDRKERDREYEYERSRDKDRDRKRRRDREADDDEREHDDDKYRSSRRSRKDRDRERDRDRDHDDRERKEKKSQLDKEDDIVGQMMKKRPVSPPLNAPTGPSANGFSIKGRSKNVVMPPPSQPPTGPRALQPPKGPAADRNKERSDSLSHRRKSSVSSIPSGPSTPAALSVQDHYAAERERNARERDSRDKVDKSNRDVLTKSVHSRAHSSSRPSLASKRSRDDIEDTEGNEVPRSEIPRGPKADVKAPTGPASHRDKRRKSGAIGDDNIANLFTAGLRKNAKARRGGVRTEGEVDREMERVERERERERR
ncbi:uncharacterized protein K460DRAFT_392874 [Cucurbitaria berberidis CBS 394.84]|uniref:RING-type domain-containing protein n=1 Tax=Cucurbitaria berberidis CBS 394.84 TaxID=1168544 RepID=A0A9P4LAI5_9PLEO|nr:uncharacterized protein K460DRAFT_392874 [Cucurbitaria berberidis CBS 394.84]KAF1847538.1 hypothetical protein K460DRAFT_392874 [Cucurbitaria berberidis CBS 394.84]